MSLAFDDELLQDGLLNDLLSYLGQSDAYPQSSSTLLQPSTLDGGQVLPVLRQPDCMAPALPAYQDNVQESSGDPTAEGNSGGRGNKRQRQRDAAKVKELEALAAAKMEEFALLVQRNAELKFRSKILTDAVKLRDIQLRVGKGLTESRPGVPQQALPNPGTSSSYGHAPVGSGFPSGRGAASMAVAEAIRMPGSVWLLHAGEVLPPADVDRIRSIGRLELVSRYKEFLAAISELLLALETNPDDEQAAVRVRNVIADSSMLFRSASVLAPGPMAQFLQTHLETGVVTAPEADYWNRVMLSLQLTPEQAAEIAAVYGLFSDIMRGILADRRALNAQLAQGLQTDPRVAAAQVTRTVPLEQELLPVLERNMRKEASAHLLVRGFLFGRTFSILQFCRAMVQSYPYFPNATALAAATAGVQA